MLVITGAPKTKEKHITTFLNYHEQARNSKSVLPHK